MKKQIKTSVAMLTAALLSSSALASEAKQDTSFLKAPVEKAPAAPVDSMEAPKNMYFALEATYDFNEYKPKFEAMPTNKKDYNDSASFGLGLGMIIDDNIRADIMLSHVLEADYNLTTNPYKYKSQVSSTKLMLNGTYDFDTGTPFSPYVSAGVGASYNKIKAQAYAYDIKTNSGSDYKIDFAYQAGLGVAYKMDNQMRLNLGYRFADNGKTKKATGVSNDRLQSHAVTLGLQVAF